MKMTSCSLLDLRNDNWTSRSAGACQGLGGRNALNFFERLTAFRSYAKYRHLTNCFSIWQLKCMLRLSQCSCP